MSPAAAAAGLALEETVNETETRRSLPPIVVRESDAERIVRDGEGEPIVLDFDALVGGPAHYAVGVDNADTVATCDTLEEALEAARAPSRNRTPGASTSRSRTTSSTPSLS